VRWSSVELVRLPRLLVTRWLGRPPDRPPGMMTLSCGLLNAYVYRKPRLGPSHLEVSMSTPSLQNAMDHVVVVMFENRSFDNLLGRL
jgi:phospholipase C